MPDLNNSKGETPELATIDGIPGWSLPSGKFYPIIAGGEGEGAGTGAGAAAGAGTAGGAGDQGGGKEGDADGEFDKERAMATIKKLRENEKATKTQLKELEELRAKLAAHEQEKMTEAEKAAAAKTAAERERDEAKAESRRLWVERAIEKAAAKAGLDPELAASLLKPESLEVDDKGNPTGIDDALKALLEKWPHLKGGEKQAAPNINAGDRGGDKHADAYGGLTKKEFAARYGIDEKYLP